MTNRLTSASRSSSTAPSLPRPPSAPVNAPEQMRHTSEVGNNDDDVVALASSPHARPDRRDTHPLDVETISDANTPPQLEDRPKHNFWLENIPANADNNNSNSYATNSRLGAYTIKRNTGSNIAHNFNANITATGALHDDNIFPIDMRKHGTQTNSSKISGSDPLDRQQRPLPPAEAKLEQPSSSSSSGRRVRQLSHPSSTRRSTRSSVAAHLQPLNQQGQADSGSSRMAAAALSQQEDAIQRDQSFSSSFPLRQLPAAPARGSSDSNALPASPLVTPPITHEYILPQDRPTTKSLRRTVDESSSATAAAASTTKAATAVATSSSTASPARRGVPHVYHDYSQLPDDYVAAESAGAAAAVALLGAATTGRTTGIGPPLMAAAATIRKKTGGVTTPFPEKLYDMLEAETPSDIVSWLPHGRAFIVRRPKDFTEQIMPK